ncbi:MAG: sulfatase atsG [Cytophagaceae bacterium]|nr:sulfatase atsG [Cytophagaceae bacterium]
MIKYKVYLRLLVLVGLSTLCTASKSLDKKNIKDKPNIIFILADDLTRWDTATYGSVDSRTPTIDSLAASGMKFNRCYQAAPMCSPTRHNLLTGMYPVRTGAYPNHTYAKKGTKSVVHYLEPLGYRVALSGKRHILTKEVFPFEYIDGDDHSTTDPDFEKIDSFLGDVESKDDNFALFVNFKSPHSPWTEGDPGQFDKDKVTLHPYLADTPKTREQFINYLAEINYLDGQIKQTMNLLKKHGFAKNTIVMFSTEQGSSMPFAKWTLYNAGVGSGLIVNWPGKIKPGSVSEALVEYSDIVPTMIDAAGGKPVKNLDGSSLLPVLLDGKKEHKEYTYALQTTRTIFSGAEYYPIRSVSNGRYRLILNLTPDADFQNTTVMRDAYYKEWKSSKDPKILALAKKYEHRPAIELYDDKNDPYDQHDLAGDPQHASLIKELRQKLYEWMSYCGDKGIRTELEANIHTNHRVNATETVSMHLDALPAQKKGNIEVKEDGYYIFYLPRGKKSTLMIDGEELFFGNHGGKEYSNYVVASLQAGKHKILQEPETRLEWTGPEIPRTKFKIK